MLETLICGDSQISASDLHRALDQLDKKDKKYSGMTGLEKQFQVSQIATSCGLAQTCQKIIFVLQLNTLLSKET